MAKLSAGQRNRSVILRTSSVAATAEGRQSATPSTLATVWARRTDTGGQESWMGRRILSTVSAVFEILYRTDVTPQMQVVDGSEVFEILAVQKASPSGGGYEGLELMCRRFGA